MKNCCYGCDKRHVGCHSTCEEYLKEHKRHMAEKEKEQKARVRDYQYNDYMVKRHDRGKALIGKK